MESSPCTTSCLDEQTGAPLLSTLREGTREWHLRVEARLQPAGQWTLVGYAAMLRAFHQVIHSLEPQLCKLLGDAFIPPPPFSRTDRIRKDLEELGAAPLTTYASPLRVESAADAYGIGYVLQGSLLGGAVIARQLRAAYSNQPVPTAYLELYGDELPGAWRRFCHELNSFGRKVTADERQQTTQAAIDTFRAFESAFERCS